MRGTALTTLGLRGKGLVRGGEGGRGGGGSRPVPQRELRVLEPPSCPLYHEGANGFPREHPFRVGLNGLDTIPHEQCELRVRPMPLDPDPNSAVAQTRTPTRTESSRFPKENTRPELSKQTPVGSPEEIATAQVPRTRLISIQSKSAPFRQRWEGGRRKRSKLSPSRRRLAEAKKNTSSQHA